MQSNSSLADLCKMPYLLIRNNTVIDAGDAFLKLTGYTKEDILQKTIYEIVKHVLRVNASFKEITTQRDKYYFAFTKSFDPIEISISIIDCNNNKKYYIFSEKENSRIDNNMLFLNKLFNDNHFGIAVFSSPGFVLLKCNEKYAEYMGKPFDKKDSCIGFNLSHLLPEFDRSESKKRWSRIVLTGETVYLKQFKNGIGGLKGRYWENTIVPVIVDNKVKYITSMLVDITEKVEAKKCLENQSRLISKQNKQLQAVIESMEDHISLIDKDGKYLRLSMAQKERLKPSMRCDEDYSLSGSRFYTMDGKEIPISQMAVSKILRGEKIKNEKIFEIINGKKVYYDISGMPILEEDGTISMGIMIQHNITELISKTKLIEQQKKALLKYEREKNEALERIINMKDEFLSLISHEFRTPINVISTAIQAMESIYGHELSDKMKNYIHIIRQNCYRQLRLVNNLLDITRANAGRIKICKKNRDIVFMTKAITESVYTYASQKGIRISFISSVKKKIIGIDDEKYERILLNLLSNAIKFTPEGKSIKVKLYLKKGRVYIEVIDEGIGIPEDKASIIFERFGQVDSSLSRQAEGTGIGLSLVKQLTEALGGSISLSSKVDKGSTFTVSLPDEMVTEELSDKQVVNLMDNRLMQTADIEFSDIYL